jgi:hypothetical protein
LVSILEVPGEPVLELVAFELGALLMAALGVGALKVVSSVAGIMVALEGGEVEEVAFGVGQLEVVVLTAGAMVALEARTLEAEKALPYSRDVWIE